MMPKRAHDFIGIALERETARSLLGAIEWWERRIAAEGGAIDTEQPSRLPPLDRLGMKLAAQANTAEGFQVFVDHMIEIHGERALAICEANAFHVVVRNHVSLTDAEKYVAKRMRVTDSELLQNKLRILALADDPWAHEDWS